MLKASIDTKFIIETPEGVDLELQVAGPLVRSMALLIDYFIKAIIMGGAYFIFSFGGLTGQAILMLLVFMVEWFYPVFFEMLRQGQTPGKKVFHLKVIHADGTPISWGASILRNLLRTADFLPIGYVLGLITMVTTQHMQRLGDLVAGTLVVFQEGKELGSKERKLSDRSSLTPVAPFMPLTANEQRVILEFSDRIKALSDARAFELANYLDEWLDRRDEQAVQRLRSIAMWLRGGRL